LTTIFALEDSPNLKDGILADWVESF
jgi:hypothetical protein